MLLGPAVNALGINVTHLIVCSLEPWDEIWRRNQYLLDGLLLRDPSLRVLFVEPASDPAHLVRIGQRPRMGRALSEVPGYAGRLHRLELTKWLPRSLGPWADRLLRRGVIAAARQLGMAQPVLWINDPGWAHLMTATGWPALYDVTDDWVEADRPPREHRRIIEHEQLLMDRCRVVVVCSPVLERTKGRLRPVVLIQNAVDRARYRQPLPRPADLEGRTAVYVGTLHEDRLDVELCARIGSRLAEEDASLVFVGPNALSAENTETLTGTSGVRLLGARPHNRVPAYLQHADVLVVPHKVDEFTDSLDPIKLYEYQAAGRPIASTPVSGFAGLKGLQGVAIGSADELPEAIVKLMRERPAQVGPFDSADWSERVTSMQSVLCEVTGH